MNNNAEHALAWIKRFGYLRNADIANLLFAGRASAKRLAQMLTKKLVASKAIVEHQQPGCVSHYACKGDESTFGCITGHRDAANEVAIQYLLRGHTVVTDREIQKQPDKAHLGKIPDTLIIDEWTEELGAARADYIWIEIENSKRSDKDVAKIGDWLMSIFHPTVNSNWHVLPAYKTGYIQQVRLIISNSTADKNFERVLQYITDNYSEHADWIRKILPQRLRWASIV